MGGVRKGFRRVVVLAVALGLLLLAAQQARAASAPPDFYGINAFTIRYSDPTANWDTHLRSMRSLGFTELRRDASWRQAQPDASDAAAGRYHFEEFDRFVAALARHGLRWYPLLLKTPAWAALDGTSGSSRPADPAAFAAYARAFAARYGAGGRFWAENPQLPYYPTLWYEVWNEPNYDRYWAEQQDAPERYADLALAATAAIKSVDPGGKVVVGVLSRPDPPFIRRMAARQPALLRVADALGVHTYFSLEENLRNVAGARAELDRLGGPGKDLVVSEVGYSTVHGGVSEDYRASALSGFAAALAASDCRVAKVQPQLWNGRERDPNDFEDWMGIANLDGSPKPTALAYAQVIHSPAQARQVCYPRAKLRDRRRAKLRAKLRVMLRLVPKRGKLVLLCRARPATRAPCRVTVRARYGGALWRSRMAARPPYLGAPARLAIRPPLVARFKVRIKSRGQRASASIVYKAGRTPRAGRR